MTTYEAPRPSLATYFRSFAEARRSPLFLADQLSSAVERLHTLVGVLRNLRCSDCGGSLRNQPVTIEVEWMDVADAASRYLSLAVVAGDLDFPDCVELFGPVMYEQLSRELGDEFTERADRLRDAIMQACDAGWADDLNYGLENGDFDELIPDSGSTCDCVTSGPHPAVYRGTWGR